MILRSSRDDRDFQADTTKAFVSLFELLIFLKTIGIRLQIKRHPGFILSCQQRQSGQYMILDFFLGY